MPKSQKEEAGGFFCEADICGISKVADPVMKAAAVSLGQRQPFKGGSQGLKYFST